MFSKYPIAKTDSIFFAGNALAQIVDILVEEDTLRIVNIHLQTTYLNQTFNKYRKADIAFNGDSRKYFNDIFDKLYRSNQIRMKQINIINNSISKETGSLIICGDFNETNFTYGYKQLKKGLKDGLDRKRVV